jgi:hypothetical protein
MPSNGMLLLEARSTNLVCVEPWKGQQQQRQAASMQICARGRHSLLEVFTHVSRRREEGKLIDPVLHVLEL